MAKFKVGDRIVPKGEFKELIDDQWNRHWKARFGELSSYYVAGLGNGIYDCVELGNSPSNKGPFWQAEKFELAPKFAVGDRVRLVESGRYNGNGEYGKTGEQGSVVRYTNYDDIYEIDFDESGRWWAEANNLVAVAAAGQPLTVRAGRHYKTRDGRKVGPMEAVCDGFTANERIDGIKRLWQGNGAHGATYVANDARLDIIAEWVDEPAAVVASFKVGDRVEFIATTGSNGRLIGKRGVIAATYDDGYDWCIRLDEYNVSYGHGCDGVVEDGYGRYADSKDLRLVAPATSGKSKFRVGDKVVDTTAAGTKRKGRAVVTAVDNDKIAVRWADGSGGSFWNASDFVLETQPAIVALIKNGQPKPASRPFVHPDREAATKEACRLAGKHKGQEFGVYELVSSEKQAKVYEHEWQRLAAGGDTYHARRELQRTGITGIQASSIVQEFVAAA